MKNLHAVPVATILVVIIAIAGAVVVIVHPHDLSFATYIKGVGVAVGLLAIGRGLDAQAKP